MKFLFTLLAAALLYRPAAAASRRSVHDAFLHVAVGSVPQLARRAETDAAFRARLARHFGVSEDSLAPYIRANLVVSRLPAARVMTTYGVTSGGRIYPVRQRLRRGTRVFATRQGDPVLKFACANPLATRLPHPRVRVKPLRMPTFPPPAPVLPPPDVVPAESVMVATLPTGTLAPPELAPPSLIGPIATVPLVPVITTVSRPFLWWLPVGVGASLVSIGSGGGGITPPPRGVPEASSGWLLLLGVPAAAGAARTHRRPRA
jgi:hypothetical protein